METKSLIQKLKTPKGILGLIGCIGCSGLLFVCAGLVALGNTLPAPEENKTAQIEATITPSVSITSTETSSTPTPTPTPTAVPTEPPKPKSKPKIDFSGKVDPVFASRGDKVVITFTIQNLDEEQSIDGMRILFSNPDFVNKGLNVVNIIGGGTWDGRAFEWKTDALKLEPKMKKNFVIVANAKQSGDYESIVTFKAPYKMPEIDDGGHELKTNLFVL